MSISLSQAIRAFLLAATLLAFGMSPLGCATSQTSTPTDSGDWPATIPALRDAIEIERARLKEIVSQPAEGSARSSVTPDDLIVIANRLSRLQASLERLEAEALATSETAAQSPSP